MLKRPTEWFVVERVKQQRCNRTLPELKSKQIQIMQIDWVIPVSELNVKTLFNYFLPYEMHREPLGMRLVLPARA